jgi:hypothetical protein
MRRGLSSTLIATMLVVRAASAQETTTDNSALATELFNAGRDLMTSGNFAAACPKLAESARLDTKVGTLGKLAECEEKSGRLVSARARWQQALNVARAQNDSRIDRVTSELDRLDKLVPKLNLTMKGASPPDLVLKVDALQVSAASLGTPIPVEPGRHTVLASASGRAPWSMAVETASDGATTEVVIPELPPQQAAPTREPAASNPKESARPVSSGGIDLRTIGLVAAGVGVASAIVGTVFAFQAKSKYDDSLKGGCVEDNCTPAGAVIRNDARSAGDLASIFVIGGGVLIAGGGAMWLFAPAPVAPSSAGVRLVPGIGLHGGALNLKGSW